MAELRLILFSDLHLSNSLPHARPAHDGVTDRLRDQQALLRQIGRDAEAWGASAVLGLGDIFDKHVLDGPTLSASMEAFKDFPVPVFIGPGNHEAASPRGGKFVSDFIKHLGDHSPLRLRWMGQASEGAAIGAPTRVNLDAAEWFRNIWWVDYCPPDEAERRIERVREASERYALTRHPPVLLLHHAIKGCKDGGWTCDDGLDPHKLTAGFSTVVSGHFHDPQTFGKGGSYIGATMQLDFGDAGARRGWLRMTMHDDGTPIAFEHMPSGAPRFHEVRVGTWDMGDFHPEIARDLIGGEPMAGDYLRIIVRNTRAYIASVDGAVREWAAACKEAFGFRLVDVVPEPIYHHDPSASRLGAGVETADARDLIARWVERAVVSEGLDPERLIEVGREIFAAASAEET